MAAQIEELQVKLTVESAQLKAELKLVKQNLQDMAQQAKKSAGDFSGLNNALSQMGLGSSQIQKINKELRESNPRILAGQLAEVGQQLQSLGVDSKQIGKIQAALTESDTKAVSTAEAMKAFKSSLDALGAGAALGGMVQTVNSLANEAAGLNQAYSTLAETSKILNVDVNESTGLADKLSERWGLSRSALADTIKTYLQAGLTLQQTEEIITATADASAYNRDASLSWEKAIQQVAQGVKSGNSGLIEAAGITQNLSAIQDQYAQTIGTTAGKLTESQKTQAAFNGILESGALFAGNADSAMTGFSGAQATFNQTIQTARTELGEAFMPVLQSVLETITPLISAFAKWADGNKELVAGIGGAAIAFTGFIALVGVLATAFVALNAAMGGIGIVLTLVGAAISGVAAYAFSSDSAARSVLQFAKSQEELNMKLSESPITNTVEDIKAMQADIEKLSEVMDRRNKLLERYKEIEGMNKKGLGSPALTSELFDLADAVRGVDKELKKLGKTPEEAAAAITDMEGSIRQSVPALLEMEKAQMSGLASQVEHIAKISQLRDRYNELSQVQNLDQKQKSELVSVVNALKKEYPDVLATMDKEQVLHISNIDLISKRIDTEKELVDKTAKGRKENLESIKATAIAELKFMDARIAQYQALEAAIKGAADDGELSSDDLFAERAYRRANSSVSQLSDSQLKLNAAIIDADKLLASIDSGNYKTYALDNPFVAPDKKTVSEGGKSAAEIAADLKKKEFQDEMALIRFKSDLEDWSAEQQLERYKTVQEKHKEYLKTAVEDERSLQLLLKSLNEQKTADAEKASKASFDFSSEWIEMEERRMRERGATDLEILTMQLEAWTRVRGRYEENTELYKQADKSMYEARMALLEENEQAQKEAEDARKERITEVTGKALDALEKLKNTELKDLEERRKAVVKFYDDQRAAVDDSERLRERNALVAEMETYRYATSEKGQKTFLELQEKLRKMDVEDQKANLDKQRNQELEKLDGQKTDIETWYEEMKTAANGFSGDLSAIYSLAEDNRLAAFISTNAKIKAEMDKYAQELSQIPVLSPALNAADASTIYQMQANSAAWRSAADETARAAYAKANLSLGDSIGSVYNSAEGVWYKNGLPLYHSGGIPGEMGFMSGSMLLPDEVYAILKRGEPVLTQDQLGSLVSAVSSGGGGATVHIEKFMEVNDPHFEDGIDLRAFGRETGGEAAELLRKQLTGR
jgi:hypothetical protein